MNSSLLPTIRYYDWEGDACQVWRHANGDLTATIYHAGTGAVETDAGDIISGAKPIGKRDYQEMVLEKIALKKIRLLR